MTGNDLINVIVSYLPFKKLKNAVRELLYYSIFHRTYSTKLWIHNAQLSQYYIDDPDRFYREIDEFKKNMDRDSVEAVDRYVIQVKSLIQPKVLGFNVLDVPYAANYFSDEQKIIWHSRDHIYYVLQNRYKDKKYDISDLDISLHIHYYECGIVLLPQKIRNRFPGSIAIDCGAWIGDSAIMLLEEHNFKTVHAFEPMNDPYTRLTNSIKKYNLSDRLIAHKLACSDKSTEKNMIFENTGSRIVENKDDYGYTYSEDIKTVTIDDYFQFDQNDDVSLIKMDVEGYEEQTLLGAEKTIKKYKPVLLISCYHDMQAPTGQMFRIKKYIESLNLGYKIMFRGLEPFSSAEYNLICYVPQ